MYIPFGDLQALHEERVRHFQKVAERRRLVAEARDRSRFVMRSHRWVQTEAPTARDRAA